MKYLRPPARIFLPALFFLFVTTDSRHSFTRPFSPLSLLLPQLHPPRPWRLFAHLQPSYLLASPTQGRRFTSSPCTTSTQPRRRHSSQLDPLIRSQVQPFTARSKTKRIHSGRQSHSPLVDIWSPGFLSAAFLSNSYYYLAQRIRPVSENRYP
ncbi:hypothetical protein V8F06_007697 [Rhypophila decipiens]